MSELKLFQWLGVCDVDKNQVKRNSNRLVSVNSPRVNRETARQDKPATRISNPRNRKQRGFSRHLNAASQLRRWIVSSLIFILFLFLLILCDYG